MRVGVEAPDDGGSRANHLEEPDVLDATFCPPDLTVSSRLDELGLLVSGLRLDHDRAVLECRVEHAEGEEFCRRCGAQACLRGTVTRWLAYLPVGWHPTTLLVRIRRYACTACKRVSRQDTTKAADPRRRSVWREPRGLGTSSVPGWRPPGQASLLVTAIVSLNLRRGCGSATELLQSSNELFRDLETT